MQISFYVVHNRRTSKVEELVVINTGINYNGYTKQNAKAHIDGSKRMRVSGTLIE